MWKQFKKEHWSKNSFGELSQQGLQEDFESNENLALGYLNGKFWEEVTDQIKEAVRKQLLANPSEYDNA